MFSSLSMRAEVGVKWWLTGVVAAFVLVWGVAPATACDEDVARVEEDWEIRLDLPSEEKTAPQYETVMSSVASIGGRFFRATWNYQELPSYASGGFQLQKWYGPIHLGSHNQNQASFASQNEQITWTQALSVDGEYLTFQVQNGQSSTWGSFGSVICFIEHWSSLSHLNNYSPDFSVEKAGISYGSNRVKLLRLKEVRYYNSDGVLLEQDTTSRVVYQDENGSSDGGETGGETGGDG